MAYIGRDIDKISNVEVLDNITFDGSSSYTLQKGGSNFTPSSANTLLVSIDGVVQAGNFTVSGSTINFGTAVSASSTCNFILHYGVGLITAPADGTVTTAKLADSSVTTAKLNDASVSLAKLTATGTKDATTFLRGDNTFASPSGGTNTPAFIVYLTSQSISSATETKLQFNSKVLDTDNCFDAVTNYRFTPTTAGYYHLRLSAGGSLYSAYEGLIINKNGGTKIYVYDADISSSYLESGTFITYFNGTTDYVEAYIYLASARTLTGNASGTLYTRFSGYKLIE